MPPIAELVESCPAQLLPEERWILYSIVRGLQPKRCLEIGTLHGGSALLTVAALDEIGAGTLICVDDCPRISAENWALLQHRVVLKEGKSADVLATLAGEQFDFAFVDGDHSTQGAATDLELIIPMMSPGAYIACHDSHYEPVRAAIDAVLSRHPKMLDCGTLTKTKAWDPDRTLAWGGIRLLRII